MILLSSTDVTKQENRGKNQTNVPFFFLALLKYPNPSDFVFFCLADSLSELDHSQALETELIIHMCFEIYLMN